jgi:hypothetical protein
VNHAAGVLFERARTGQDDGARDSKPETEAMREMSHSERIQVMQMVKSGRMSISEAEAFMVNGGKMAGGGSSGGEPSAAVSAAPAQSASDNPFRRSNGGGCNDETPRPEVERRKSAIMVDDPFANPITLSVDPFADKPVASTQKGNEEGPNPFQSPPLPSVGSPAKPGHKRAPSANNPFNATTSATEPSLQPFWGDNGVEAEAASPPATPSSAATPEVVASMTPNPFSGDSAVEAEAASPPATPSSAATPEVVASKTPNPFSGDSVVEAEAALPPATPSSAATPENVASMTPNPFSAAATPVSATPPEASDSDAASVPNPFASGAAMETAEEANPFSAPAEASSAAPKTSNPASDSNPFNS